MNVPALVPEQKTEDFADGVYPRLVRAMVVLALLAAPVVWLKMGRSASLAFLGGSAIALLNFYWLKRTIESFIDRAVSSGEKQSSIGVIFRFLLRYILIAVALYVIFNGSAIGVYGLIGGLSLPVGAVMIEAVYQVFSILKHDSEPD